MANYSIVFSPAGGTRKTADMIASGFGGYETIDLTQKGLDFSSYELGKDDLVLISMPSFRGRAPEVALDRLMEMEGCGAKAVLNCTYGGREYEDTLVEMEDAAEKAGFQIVAAIASLAQHSQLSGLCEGRPDYYDNDKLKFYGRMVSAKVASGDLTKPQIPGKRPYKEVSYTITPPTKTDACLACGKCAKRCPVGAIDKETKVADPSLCILCTRCVHICPNGARKLEEEGLEALRKRLEPYYYIRKAPELHI